MSSKPVSSGATQGLNGEVAVKISLGQREIRGMGGGPRVEDFRLTGAELCT